MVISYAVQRINGFNFGNLKMKSAVLKTIVIFAVTLIPLTAKAWDGTTAGKINTIDVTGGTNYGFRVSLEGGPALCGNAHTWAFLNETDSNYQTYVSVLLAAKAAKMTVRLYTTRVGSNANGFCQIGYIQVN